MIYSASSVASVYEFGEGAYWLKRQLIWATAGLFLIFVTMNIPYGWFKKLSPLLLVFSFTMLILVLVPGIGSKINGAQRWFRFGKFSFQPSELAILSAIIYFARSMSERVKDNCNYYFHKEILVELAVLGGIFFLILKQPNLSMAIIVSLIYFTMLLASGIKKRVLLVFALIGILGFAHFSMARSYRMKRIMSWLNIDGNQYQGGYHIIQSLTAVGSGGITGKGFGNSTQKFLYLPERHTDFIFSIIAEEFGLMGTSIVLILFLLLIMRGLKIAEQAKDRFGGYLAFGMTSLLGFQVLINVSVVLNLLPATGLPLPFISYGGSSYMVRAITVGILLNISRSLHEKPVTPKIPQLSPRMRDGWIKTKALS